MLVLLAVHAAAAVAMPWCARWLGRDVWLLAVCVPLATVVWASVRSAGVLGGTAVGESVAWAPALGLELRLRLDALALLMVWVIGGVGAAVLVYSRYHLSRDPGRAAGLLLAFAGAMTGLVLADNLFLLYVFWELTTIASFFLIAGRGEQAVRRRAARQALLVTTSGGLLMLLGFVLLGQAAGGYGVASLVAEPPRGGAVTAAVVLVLVGAFAKSAQMPLHGWLPAAMVAPTPVSAFLHAAAMVKAGVYLVARLAPGLAEVAPWRPMVFTVGLVSLVLGAWRALRETDLKRLLAYGTVSELGLLVVLLGAGTRTAALAGEVMLLAHAMFKAALFLVVGLWDHHLGSRDLRELSGAARTLPTVAVVAVAAAASMAGVPPALGFLGKEAAYEAFAHGDLAADPLVLTGVVAGSALTVAYAVRFLRGAFGGPAAEPRARGAAAGYVAPAALLAAAGLATGLWYGGTQAALAPYADTFPAGAGKPYELALWHGPTAAAGLSVLTLTLGGLGYLLLGRSGLRPGAAAPRARLPDVQHLQERAVAGLDRTAAALTRHTEVGSLPVYLTVLLTTVALVPGVTLIRRLPPLDAPSPWAVGLEVPVAAAILASTAAVVVTRRRLTGILLAGAVGYGVATLFLLYGAPDLALTQFLVETMTLVVVVLVLRRLPPRFTLGRTAGRARVARAAAAAAVGCLVGGLALLATSARTAPAPAGAYLRRLAETGAENAVNAIIVDFRALDTIGEVSVLLVTSIGVVSLVRLWSRGAPERREPKAGDRPLPRMAHEDEPRERWLPGADERPGGERSVLLEVITRLLFPSALVLSLFLLFSGHYGPGGGFAGGLVAGQAFVLRYLVGGRADLGAASPVGAGQLAGGGLALMAGLGLLPWLFGGEPLSSALPTARLPWIGDVHFSTSVFFDVGVYLLVLGVTLKLLSAVGVSLDRAPEAERTGGSRS
ncbi:Na+/H+ antiporter subunit A [Streptomyces sp. WMMC897]|uniref:Na+/H+ antiporter subunit A n=1 Tax=Streptomyces sp. WMMC897 TaxID=3014782 RepID=UPI0022B6AE48|nr:Na+/H+ antiporter subunit A [Streptomyces sp. WMMC897]MCZ7414341.1 Na+/H+ antiporter subunit A [Streptomyces sp. WMMC897]